MTAQESSTTVFSVKYDPDTDDFELIPEDSDNSNYLDFQSTFSKSVRKNTSKSTGNASSSRVINPLLLNSTMKPLKKEALYTCKTCKKTYKSKAVYTKHIYQCSPDSLLPDCLLDRTRCFCCEEPIANGHEGTNPCEQCPKSFKSICGLTRHVMLLHSKSVNFKCELCNAQCSNKYILKLHRQSHNEDLDCLTKNTPEYKCNHCNRMFLERTAFDIHIDNHKRNKIMADVSYKCRECGMDFTSLDKFDMHECITDKKAKYKCNLCGKILSSHGFFKRHINTHKKYNENAESIISQSTKAKSTEMDKTENFDMIRSAMHADGSKNTLHKLSNIKSEPFVRVLNGVNSAWIRSMNPTTNIVEMANNVNEDGVMKEATPSAIKVENNVDILDLTEKRELDNYSLYQMDEIALAHCAIHLLRTLLGNDILHQFGWPTEPIQKVLIDVLKYCDIKPTFHLTTTMQLRENIKNLVATLTNNTFENEDAVDVVIKSILKICE